MNKETLISVISKMIDCGQISTQAVQALSSLGYVEAKGVVEICVRNRLVKKDGDMLFSFVTPAKNSSAGQSLRPSGSRRASRV